MGHVQRRCERDSLALEVISLGCSKCYSALDRNKRGNDDDELVPGKNVEEEHAMPI